MPDPTQAPELPLGALLAGRYRIEAELGRGGMGRVVAARDLKLGRRVAIELLSVHLASGQHVQRFEQEARAAGGLEHPNVLAVYDLGEHEGAPFIVTELLRGTSARAALASGPMAPARVVELGVQLARGLAAAHAQGVIHRDLKPDNLFLTEGGRLKILDFGLAKLVAPDDEPTRPSGHRGDAAIPTPVHTASNTIFGTPGYMAPEQVSGEPVDARADVFAAGVVLYELLTGERPFGGSNFAEVGYATLHLQPAPLPETVRPELRAAILRCLARRREDRFAGANELLAALEALREGASPPATPRPPEPLAAPPPAMLGSAAALPQAVAESTPLLPGQARPATPDPAAAPLPGQRGARRGPLLAAVAVTALLVVGAIFLARLRAGQGPAAGSRTAADSATAPAPADGGLAAAEEAPRPLLAVAPFAAEGASQDDAKLLHKLVLREAERLLEPAPEPRLVAPAGPPPRTTAEAQALARQARAQWVLWGEVLSLGSSAQLRLRLEPGRAGSSAPVQLEPQRIDAGAGDPIEARSAAARAATSRALLALASARSGSLDLAVALALVERIDPERQSPEACKARAGLLGVLANTGRVQREGALEAYQRWIALAPRSAEAHEALGRFLELGHTAEAAAAFKAALALEPKRASAWLALGTAQEKLGRLAEAAASLESAAANDLAPAPSAIDELAGGFGRPLLRDSARTREIVLLVKLGRAAEAARLVQRITQPGASWDLEAADGLSDAGFTREALELYDRARGDCLRNLDAAAPRQKEMWQEGIDRIDGERALALRRSGSSEESAAILARLAASAQPEGPMAWTLVLAGQLPAQALEADPGPDGGTPMARIQRVYQWTMLGLFAAAPPADWKAARRWLTAAADASARVPGPIRLRGFLVQDPERARAMLQRLPSLQAAARR